MFELQSLAGLGTICPITFMPKKLRRTIGNALILLSSLLFVLLFAPLLMTYIPLTSPPASQISSANFTLSIPKIRAYAPVIANVDPWDEKIYRNALKRGVAHAKGTALPGTGKTVYLFAHSTRSPWDQLYYNTVFLRLGELEEGDEITLELNNKQHHYLVTEKKEVQPNEIEYLQDIDKDRLILQTCTPIGTTLRRLLIFAEPRSNPGEPVTRELLDTKYEHEDNQRKR
jgi:sortase A